MQPPAVGFQGERGAFSEDAVQVILPGSETVPLRTLRSLFDALASDSIVYGVVPLENSVAGSINETYDLLAAGTATIVAEALVAVDHALLATPGTRVEDVRRVSSHPQALAQCDEYLAGLDAELIPVYDTAGAAERVARGGHPGETAIASERAAEMYGLEVLARRIQTNPDNQTRFVAVARERPPLGPADKTSLLLVVGHRPGALYRSLRPFAERELNLSKLESRPLPGEPWRYRFYLDVESGTDDPALGDALDEVKAEAALLQVLGSYPRWQGDPARP